MRRHLDNIESREELITLSERRREIESGLARRYVSVVAKAPGCTKRNATPACCRPCPAMQRPFAGSARDGPNATRYRRDAREAMLDAAGAVPCWIMSHARISESIPAEIGAFDLVIVDEASQSDLWALPAILRARRSWWWRPQAGLPGCRLHCGTAIQELKQRFLAEQPYRDEMTPREVAVQLAVRVYSAANIMLREHFRCVPPIIAYFKPGALRRSDPPIRSRTPRSVSTRPWWTSMFREANATSAIAMTWSSGHRGGSRILYADER